MSKRKRGQESEDSIYYYVDDIRRLLDYQSDAAAYRVIRQMNNELKEQGYVVKQGAVPKEFFNKRYYGQNEHCN